MPGKESTKSVFCTLTCSRVEGYPVCEVGSLCMEQQVMTNETKDTSHPEVLC